MAEGKNLFRFVHGDEENLAGEAIIFSMLTEGQEKRPISIYVTSDFQRLKEKFSEVPIGELEKIIQLLENLGGNYAGYATWIDSEKESKTHTGDIIEIQDFDVPKLCQQAVILGGHKYLGLYAQQLERRTGIKRKNYENPQRSFLESISITQRSAFARITHYISQMEAANREGDIETFMEEEEQLMSLSKEIKYRMAIGKIADLLKAKKKNSDDKLPNNEDYIFALKKEALGYCVSEERPRFSF